ncbi:transaldolase, partial [Pseudomonadales bacterium]|nr:transaldolase [Pseudomonadales bacterium]
REALVPIRLDANAAKLLPIEKISMGESRFRWQMNEDAMATDKLSQGIRQFHADYLSLRQFLAAQS